MVGAMRGLVALGALACELRAASAYVFGYDGPYLPNGQHSVAPAGPSNLTAAQWSAVPLLSEQLSKDVTPNLPAGCSCVNDQQSNVTCTSFTCSQTCDLNKGQCDAYCCSDPDCSADEVARFRSTGQCLADGSTASLVTRCSDVSTLDKVNAKFNMYVSSDDNALNGLLCVSVENSPYEGEFYLPQTDKLGNTALLRTLVPGATFQSKEETSSNDTLPFFRQGGAVPAAVAGSVAAGGPVNLQAVFGGFLPLPARGAEGECTFSNFVAFAEDVQRNDCVQPLASLEAACNASQVWGGGLSSAALLTGTLFVGTGPQSVVADVAGWVQLRVGQVYYKNPVTGALAGYGAAPVPLVNTTNATTGASQMAPPEWWSRNTTWDAATQTCYNAVAGLKYALSHNTAGYITAARVDLVLTHLAATAAASGGSSTLALQQTFQVAYTNINSVAPNATTVARVVSGNPGYITGLPVQAGIAVSAADQAAVAYQPAGLQIMAAAGSMGSCFAQQAAGASASQLPFWETLGKAAPSTTPVLFGVDASSSCTIEMTYDTFVNNITQWCVDMSASPLFQAPAGTVLGIYGNANPLQSHDWIPLEVDRKGIQPTARSPMPGALLCNNFVDAVDVELLWTKSGTTRSPQPMLLAARAVLKQSAWRWRQEPLIKATQKFTISSSVTFVELKLDSSQRSNYKPEPVSVMPQLAYDVFYPFDILVQGSPAGPASGKLCLALLALALRAQY
jgi:hypothetical protein